MGRTALLIANPAAGFGPASRRAEHAARRLTELGLRAELYRTREPRDAEQAAREASARFDLVISAGGDGTLHEVANGLAGTQTPLGILPLGSMNILAREIGMPLDVNGACAWIALAEPRPITLGEREGGRYFVIMAGIGYDAFALETALDRARRAGRKVRFTDYALAATQGAASYRFPRIGAEADGRLDTGAFALIANCARYGANLRIARDARLDEPLLDLVLFQDGDLASRLRYLAAVIVGRPAAAKGVVYRKVERVAVESVSGARVPCQLDGERSGSLPASFRAVPSALLLLRSPKAA